MPTPSTQNFAIFVNAPGLVDGLVASHVMGSDMGQQAAQDDRGNRIAFENAMRAIGVGAMNFRRWLTDEYTIPAIEFAWLGWQGKPTPM